MSRSLGGALRPAGRSRSRRRSGAPDRDRHRHVLAEHDRGEDEARDRLQELQRRDAGDAAAIERPVPADVAEDRGDDREEDDRAPRLGPASGTPSRAKSADASGASTIVPSTTPHSVVARLESPRGGSIAPATYPAETQSAAASTSRSPASVASDADVPRPPISTTSPTSATAHPASHARAGTRRATTRRRRP